VFVATLDTASDKEAVFLYIVWFFNGGNESLCEGSFPLFLYSFISVFCDLFSASFPIITKSITITLVRPLIFPYSDLFF